MRAVVTRVKNARVEIEGTVNGAIGTGFLVLLGVGPEDTQAAADKLADKVCGLRVFDDENGKMNRNLAAVGGALLVVSQFTLYADTSSRRPGFSHAAKPDLAVPLYERFMAQCWRCNGPRGAKKTGTQSVPAGWPVTRTGRCTRPAAVPRPPFWCRRCGGRPGCASGLCRSGW